MAFANNLTERVRDRVNTMRARAQASKRRNALHKSILKLIETGSEPQAASRALDVFDLWGDKLDPARESYVRSCLSELKSTDGHVLLSSASLMTLVLGAVSNGDKDRTIWCLDQNPHWTNVMRSWISQYAIKRTYIISAPSMVRGGITRYRIETKHMPKNLSLILCDGDGASPGSTLSTLLSIGPHLSDEFTVFARRIRVDEDGPILKRWAARNGATLVVVNQRDGFVKITRRKAQASQGRASFEDVVSDIGAQNVTPVAKRAAG